VHILKEPKVCT